MTHYPFMALALLAAGLLSTTLARSDDTPRPIVTFAPYSAASATTQANTLKNALSATHHDALDILDALRDNPATSDFHLGRVDADALDTALDTRTLTLALPSAAARRTGNTASRQTPGTPSILTWTGADITHNPNRMVSVHARDIAADSEAALVINGPDIIGSFRQGAAVYKLHPLGDGLTALYRIDNSKLRRHPPGWPPVFRPPSGQPQRNTPANQPANNSGTDANIPRSIRQNMIDRIQELEGAASPAPDARPRTSNAHDNADDSNDVIDVLVVYTPRARLRSSGIDAFIQMAFDNTNRIYRNSNIDLRVRLAHAEEIDYREHQEGIGADIQEITLNYSSAAQETIRALRDRHHADLVVLVVHSYPDHNFCGIAYIPDFRTYPDTDWSSSGFSVIHRECEHIGSYTFAHEIGHNLGAAHDPDNTSGSIFPYGHGRCNTLQGWHTVMSYSQNNRGSCWQGIEKFSSPSLEHRGTPTGDTTRRDNRRVLIETKRRVASFRRAPADIDTAAHTLPFFLAASDGATHSFARIINQTDDSGTVDITATDDTGRRFGPVSLSMTPLQGRQFNSRDLELGNPSKGLLQGVGNGSGHWRLEFDSTLNLRTFGYIRTPDGFVTSMKDTISLGSIEGDVHFYNVGFFNPASNTRQRSVLRITNPNDQSVFVVISGTDDTGSRFNGPQDFHLEAGETTYIDAGQLEQGWNGANGFLGDGNGKWRILLSTQRPVHLMNLLTLPTGHITNLSR